MNSKEFVPSRGKIKIHQKVYKKKYTVPEYIKKVLVTFYL